MTLIKYLVTHIRPHLDEIFAILLMRQCGKEKYPGVDMAEIRFVESGNGLLPYEANCLYIGVSSDAPNGDKFDEHSIGGRPRKEGHSSASLVACDLGIEKMPEIRKLLECITSEDLSGGAGFMDLSAYVKLLYNGLDPMQVVDWATVALRARLNEQSELHDERNVKEFDRLVKTTTISSGGKPMKIGVIETDNTLASKCSRMRGFNLLIQKSTDGHVQIFPSRKDNLDMRDVVRMLRLEELEIAQKVGYVSDWTALEAESYEDCPLWYFLVEGGLVMNGSLTRKDVPVTAISLDRILQIVKFAFDDNAEYVRCDVCASSPRKGVMCGFFSAGLLHCREVRSR